MYKEHAEIVPPAGNPILWRYMDFAKFISMLEYSALFFVRVDRLSDEFEGAPSKPFLDEFFEHYKDVPEELMSKTINSLGKGRRFFVINCWCENSIESSNLWHKYTDDKYGIAVQTDFESLKGSFQCAEDIYIGKIKYIDYDSEYVRQDIQFDRYMHKRDFFKDEQEVRAIALPFPFKIEKGDIREVIPDFGHSFDVNLNTLLHKIIVSRYAPDWFLELVKDLLSRYQITSTVERSRLADKPAW